MLLCFTKVNHDRYISSYFLLIIHKDKNEKFQFLSHRLQAKPGINSSNHVITSILQSFIISMLSRYMYFTTLKC